MSAREQSTSILTMRCTISLGLGHYFPGNPKAKRMRIEKRREKCVPKSTRLDRALGRIAGGSSRSKPDATFTTGEHGRQIDISDHICEGASARQQHRVTGDSTWYEQWNAKVAERTRQVAVRAAYSVSWIE